jgi:protein involved in polysaccharide export with SLBB domain
MTAALVFALAVILSACAPAGPQPTLLALPAADLPLTPEHTLTAGDEFEIRFSFAPEFNDRVTVGQDGTVAPKLLGSVVVGGLTVPEATVRLKALYAKQLRERDMSLTVRAYAPEVYYVDGAVRRPGLIRNDLPLTAARAVAQAGGAKTGAKTGDILVIRRDPEGHVRAYQTGLDPPPSAADPFLKSFDVVYVPLSAIGSVNEFLAGYARNLPFTAILNVNPTPATNVVLPTVAPH